MGVPPTIDWRALGAVTSVGDQGDYCGTASATFATAGAVEGAWKIAGHPLIPLSEQQLIDCANKNCFTGNPDFDLLYVRANGLAAAIDYPYVGMPAGCNTTAKNMPAANISNYSRVTQSSRSALLAAVTAGVTANSQIWRDYKSGIVTGCFSGTLSMCVLIVGYNTTALPNYWIVKNSVGTAWRESGYIRLGMTSEGGSCGIGLQPYFPTV